MHQFGINPSQAQPQQDTVMSSHGQSANPNANTTPGPSQGAEPSLLHRRQQHLPQMQMPSGYHVNQNDMAFNLRMQIQAENTAAWVQQQRNADYANEWRQRQRQIARMEWPEREAQQNPQEPQQNLPMGGVFTNPPQPPPQFGIYPNPQPHEWVQQINQPARTAQQPLPPRMDPRSWWISSSSYDYSNSWSFVFDDHSSGSCDKSPEPLDQGPLYAECLIASPRAMTPDPDARNWDGFTDSKGWVWEKVSEWPVNREDFARKVPRAWK